MYIKEFYYIKELGFSKKCIQYKKDVNLIYFILESL